MAAEGKNEVARSLLDLQPTAILELYKLYPDIVDSPSVYLSFHGGSVFGGNVTWQGIEYIPIPVESEGFGVFGDGTLPRPKIKVSNNEKIVTYFLGKYKDFKNARVYRKKVFVKHLDDVNFDGNNPFGLANSDSEISEEKYLIGQKVQENKSYVEFELNLPLDLDNYDVNHRTVNAKYCYWQYRGLGCRYAGKPVEKENGDAFKDANGNSVILNYSDQEFYSKNPFYEPNRSYTVGDAAFLENKSLILGRDANGNPYYHRVWYVCVKNHSGGQHPESNPSYWQKDGCTKKIEACQKRFGNGSVRRNFSGNESASFKYMHIPEGKGVSFASKNSGLTYPFKTITPAKWTVTVWARGQQQKQLAGKWTDPSIFATKPLSRGSNYVTVADPDGTMNTKVSANLHYSSFSDDNDKKGVGLGFTTLRGQDNESQTYRAQSNFISENKFNFIVVRMSDAGGEEKIEIFANPQRSQYGGLTYESRTVINSTKIDPSGADFFSLFNDMGTSGKYETTFNGDIAQACIWRRNLSNEEIIKLGTTNARSYDEYYLTDDSLQKIASTYSDYAPLRYADATGDLANLTGDGDLVAWFDMETISTNGEFHLKDEHIGGYHLTGYPVAALTSLSASGIAEQRTISYTKANLQSFIPNDNFDYVLPFGAFPGTDGYEYQGGTI